MAGLFDRQATTVVPGAVHLPAWLAPEAQQALADCCRGWAEEGGGLRSPRMPRGGLMSVRMACLGWHWYPYRYSRTVDDGDGRPVMAFPSELGDLGRRAVADATNLDASLDTEGYLPDVALVNWYGPGARMGMHVDRDERSPSPVVSVSLGDPCVFRFGTPVGRGRPWTDVVLESGDVFVFGGPARLAYHGVPRLLPGGTGPDSGLGPGRFNITLRETGLGISCGAG